MPQCRIERCVTQFGDSAGFGPGNCLSCVQITGAMSYTGENKIEMLEAAVGQARTRVGCTRNESEQLTNDGTTMLTTLYQLGQKL